MAMGLLIMNKYDRLRGMTSLNFIATTVFELRMFAFLQI